jgi:arylsulfatase A-like enzyme
MSESARRPNVCVLVLDAVQAAHLSTYGHERETAPFLDSLADDASATVYERAVSPAGVTVDSVGSFFTGLYPGEHRAGNTGSLDVDVPHLPEHLRANGYRTGAVTCNPFLTPAFGFDDGVDEFDPITVRFDRGMNVREFFTETNDLSKPRRYLRFLRESLDRDFPWHVGNALQFRFGLFEGDDDGAALATDSSLSFAESGDGPWFLYTHYTETHMTKRGGLPYTIPPAARRAFLPEGVPDDVTLADTGPRADYDERTLDVHQRLYDGAIRYLDGQIRRVVEGLRERGEWADTLLIVTSDHGECVGEKGLLGHGVLYEPGVHVPLVVRTPEWMASPTADAGERVSTVGLYRTVAAAATGESPDHARGVDVRRETEDATLVQEYSNTWDWSRYGGLSSGEMAFYREETKLLELESGTELYDLAADPGETEDLAEAHPDRREAMQDGLAARLEGLDLASGGEMDRDFDADTEKRLRDLGYID